MAALVLSVAGSAAGSSLFGPTGALVGRLVGALAGHAIDQALFGSRTVALAGPRLADLGVMSSTAGAPIPRVYGRARVAGQVIWATRLEEVASTQSQSSGGKGMGGRVTTTTTTYSYFANLAVGLCEGPIGAVLRVWADGKPLDLEGVNLRVYRGDEAQTPDPLIIAKEGDAPAYRGLAYVVFERLPLAAFGNRIPQLSFEVVRPVGKLERMIRAVTLIPGATEFGYEPATVVRQMGPGRSAPENRHVGHAPSDVVAALDELQALAPNLARVAIVVAWFGTDLRCGQCRVMPSVDSAIKATAGAVWSVAGLDRASARLVSQVEGRPAFGGTPSDDAVRHLIAELKARGLKVTLYPFLMMDIPADNACADPWTGAPAQPAYPWRGRITCDPAPGRPGSPDGTAAAAAQVDAFFSGGPDAWNYRRMILHYATLAAGAGGVDAFLIGSELKALTRVRAAPGVYPAVDALCALAAEAKQLLGDDCVVTYGADWTEYGAHVIDANEIRFPLDRLWASPAIDVVGIDYYAPLADWREEADALDRALSASIYSHDYLAGNLRRGEAYDWFYADAAARAAQQRTPITDGLGKPWLFRQKDLWNFWSQPHYERVAGVELAAPTAWVPQSKPIWLTELGCPAVDKGANQPSVFPDPKSSESGLPHFSRGTRDDLIQRRFLEAVLGAFDPAFGPAVLNPLSSLYGGRMIAPDGIHLWTWDARPYPSFPAAEDVWSDGANWQTGHWLTGRLGGAPLDGLVAAVLADSGIAGADTSALGEGPDGYVVDRPMSARAMLDPLALAFAFDAAEQDGVLRFRPRGGAPVMEIDEEALALSGHGAPAQIVRAQECDLPREVVIGYTDIGADYQRAAAASRRLVGGSAHSARAELAMVASDAAARRRAEIWLQDLWAGRESVDIVLPMSRLALTPGDVIGLTVNGRRRLVEVQEIVDTECRALKGRSVDPDVFGLPLAPPRLRVPPPPLPLGPLHALVLDLPSLDATEPPVLARIAVFADPWPGPVAVFATADGMSFTRAALVHAPARMGVTLDALAPGPSARWHNVSLRVQLYGGALSSTSEAALFAGANAAALQRPDGAWEVIQFAQAELVGDRIYRLARLLRGQGGSEWAMGTPLPAGAPFVLLDEHVVPIASGLSALERPLQLRVVAASRDIGDASAVSLAATPRATALKPLAPVHVTASRGTDGVMFRWIRRTRVDGDGWVGEVPLGEASEQYALDILAAGAVVRTLLVATPWALYAAGDELADFGQPQTHLAVRVAQVSATVGRGFATETTCRL
ncbi:MAG: glycoside hydrolase/phage tail family protein [Pseudolabrys sp.]|nr:glycoside hydrolase/phage tail family protein [Pseudolabrys sp.]